MSHLNAIGPGKKAPEEIHVLVEIPKGSQNKYEVDKELGVVKLDRVLFSPFHYPGDYGYIPQTLGLDGDPVDALVLMTNPTYPGVLITARPIGALEMIDNGESDDKILCVPVDDVRFKHVHDLSDIEEPTLNEIAHFFEVYKQLEKKKVEIIGWKNKAEAHEIIKKGIEDFKG